LLLIIGKHIRKVTFMKKRIKMHYILCMLIVGIVACKKSPSITEVINDPLPPPPITVPETKPDPEPPIVYTKIYEVGTGSGNLSINGSVYNLNGNVLFKIKGGRYQSINIYDITTTGTVTIQNDGLVQMTSGQMKLGDLNNVTITGNGTPGIEKGFAFNDIGYRPIVIEGAINNFTFQYASFKNTGDYVITYKHSDLYNGSESSYSKNLKFLNIDCDNTGQFISAAGYVDNGLIYGLIKNLEIAYLNFKNSADVGEIVWVGNVENYDIHHNTIDNVNTVSNKHNGLFSMNGNGKFHHNRISNHQGNSIRAFSFTVGTTPKEVLIYNNIVYNSRKYSAFEVQTFTTNIIPGKTTFVNAKVFNNTCGSLNLSNDWQGCVVDVYSLRGGKCEVFNNLAYNFPAPYLIAGQQGDLVPTSYNNLYFKTSKEAGIIDETDFKLNSNSPAKGKGVYDALSSIDFYGLTRNTTPSIGAVE
jgi:hypothetical protein